MPSNTVQGHVAGETTEQVIEEATATGTVSAEVGAAVEEAQTKDRDGANLDAGKDAGETTTQPPKPSASAARNARNKRAKEKKKAKAGNAGQEPQPAPEPVPAPAPSPQTPSPATSLPMAQVQTPVPSSEQRKRRRVSTDVGGKGDAPGTSTREQPSPPERLAPSPIRPLGPMGGTPPRMPAGYYNDNAPERDGMTDPPAITSSDMESIDEWMTEPDPEAEWETMTQRMQRIAGMNPMNIADTVRARAVAGSPAPSAMSIDTDLPAVARTTHRSPSPQLEAGPSRLPDTHWNSINETQAANSIEDPHHWRNERVAERVTTTQGDHTAPIHYAQQAVAYNATPQAQQPVMYLGAPQTRFPPTPASLPREPIPRRTPLQESTQQNQSAQPRRPTQPHYAPPLPTHPPLAAQAQNVHGISQATHAQTYRTQAPTHGPLGPRAPLHHVYQAHPTAHPGPLNGPAPAQGPQAAPTTLTPTPSGGFRRLEGADFYWRYFNTRESQVADWTSSNRPFVLAHIAGSGTDDEGHVERIMGIQTVLRRDFNMPHARITPAVSSVRQPRHNTAPHFYHIGNLTQGECDTLIAQRWADTADATVGFEQPNHDPPTLVGFFRRPDRVAELTEEAQTTGFRTNIESSAELTTYIRDAIARDIQAGGRWRHLTIDQAYVYIILSIRVRILNRIHQNHVDPVAVLYMESPTADPSEWFNFRERVREHTFGSPHAGPPELLHDVFWCGICHSYDHPTGLCYLPLLPGWRGPTPDSLRAAAQEFDRRHNQTQGRGRGGRGGRGNRGTRGRGRGRGGN
ncbi:hypothetical protein EVJ58_g10207 [Rhodofomes roseus]|uniref:Uncharacterized protein n=1 Tax=Rhodofomes roseus TaxID=34475 RepID=A0A4Y9XPN2_9APHY|nr:hypothetical protein EVJ58_g10207 [Rhodofomes roseus]